METNSSNMKKRKYRNGFLPICNDSYDIDNVISSINLSKSICEEADMLSKEIKVANAIARSDYAAFQANRIYENIKKTENDDVIEVKSKPVYENNYSKKQINEIIGFSIIVAVIYLASFIMLIIQLYLDRNG